jgi:hypothetical protein
MDGVSVVRGRESIGSGVKRRMGKFSGDRREREARC